MKIMRLFSEIVKKSEKSLRISHEKHLSVTETGYFSNAPVTIDNKNNDLAHQILSSGRLNLDDKEIIPKAVDLETMKTLSSDYLQVDLGESKLYGKDQILLEDVDPNNIPDDKEIILWGKKTKIIAIGKPAEEYSSNNIHQAIFHEEKAKHGAGFNWKTYLKLIPFMPIFYYFTVYLEVIKEYYYVKSFYTALDRENIELLNSIKNAPNSTIKTQKYMDYFYPNS